MGLLVHGGITCIPTDLDNCLLIGHQQDNEAVWTHQVHETSLFSLEHLRNYWFRKTTDKTNKLEPKHAIQYHLCEKLYVWKEEYNHFIEEYM